MDAENVIRIVAYRRIYPPYQASDVGACYTAKRIDQQVSGNFTGFKQDNLHHKIKNRVSNHNVHQAGAPV